MPFAPPTSLSPSKITAFKSCALAFRFSVIDKLPEPPSPAASKGTLVHRALQLLMLLAPGERSLPAALTCLHQARGELASHPEFLLMGLSDEEWKMFHDDAASLVARYFELEDPTAINPIGLELMLTTEMTGHRGDALILRGIIDRLELDTDGELVVTDYKTGAVPGVQYEQSRLLGVHCYALLCERVLGRRPARIQLLYLSKPEMIIAEPTEQSVRGMERKTLALWDAVVRACAHEDFRPNPSGLCDWCNFRPYCPAWGGDPALASVDPGQPSQIPLALAPSVPATG